MFSFRSHWLQQLSIDELSVGNYRADILCKTVAPAHERGVHKEVYNRLPDILFKKSQPKIPFDGMIG
ncbi:hypothetical protein PhaeoP97_03362 [Phaeobacter porticola]|uniref:Uncharacterized protein n=1 Tax=Phaeobacter porticola TaxID=1844006 RepID=A0A1L3I9H6_9RHOB|nr:hypothetical protein PhaeoP97_03362 [Phaeobacter porticola]